MDSNNENLNRDTSDSLGTKGIDISKIDGGVVEPIDISRPKQRHGFQKGQSGNPAGRPKGSITVIGRLKQIFADDPELFEDFVRNYRENKDNQKHITEMIDGKPKQTIAGDKSNPLRIITIDKDLAEIHGITTSITENHSEG